ncbi:MAG: DUF4129 domain-containing protein [Candidatus Thermoplasmatota archaeon]
MDLKDKKILILSIFVVLVSSWFIGNLMNMRLDQDADPIFLGLPEGSLIAGIVIFIGLPILYILSLYYRYEGDRKPMLSGLLQLGFWIFAFIGAVLVIVLGVWPVLKKIILVPTLEVNLPRFPLLIDMGFVLILVPLVFLLFSYIYLSISSGRAERKETSLEVIDRDDLLEEEPSGEEKTMESSLSSALDRAITDLDGGGGVHSTILKCYREMSEVLEERGAVNDESMTPREFKDKTIEYMPGVEEMVSEITFLFEEARYSPHELDKRDKDNVLKQLKELKEGLS